MSKAKTTTTQKPAANAPDATELHGDGSGDAALPETATQPAELPNEAANPAPDAPLAPVIDPEQPQVEPVTVFVLCDGSFNGVTRYGAGALVAGVPKALADANKHWLDADPSAIEHAESNGAQVLDYEG